MHRSCLSPPHLLSPSSESCLLGRSQGSSPGDMLSSLCFTQPCPHTGCGWRLLKAAGSSSPTSVPLPVLTTGPARCRANEWPHLPGAWRAERDPPRTDGGIGPSLFFSASPQIQSLRFNLVSGYKGQYFTLSVNKRQTEVLPSLRVLTISRRNQFHLIQILGPLFTSFQ